MATYVYTDYNIGKETRGKEACPPQFYWAEIDG